MNLFKDDTHNSIHIAHHKDLAQKSSWHNKGYLPSKNKANVFLLGSDIIKKKEDHSFSFPYEKERYFADVHSNDERITENYKDKELFKQSQFSPTLSKTRTNYVSSQNHRENTFLKEPKVRTKSVRYSIPDETLLSLRKSIPTTDQLKQSMNSTAVENMQRDKEPPIDKEFSTFLQKQLPPNMDLDEYSENNQNQNNPNNQNNQNQLENVNNPQKDNNNFINQNLPHLLDKYCDQLSSDTQFYKDLFDKYNNYVVVEKDIKDKTFKSNKADVDESKTAQLQNQTQAFRFNSKENEGFSYYLDKHRVSEQFNKPIGTRVGFNSRLSANKVVDPPTQLFSRRKRNYDKMASTMVEKQFKNYNYFEDHSSKPKDFDVNAETSFIMKEFEKLDGYKDKIEFIENRNNDIFKEVMRYDGSLNIEQIEIKLKNNTGDLKIN